MKTNYTFYLASLLLICNCSLFAQTQERTIQHDGISRTYRLHLPQAVDTCEHLPLIFNLHGSGSTGWQEEFYTRFSSVADTGRFIAVYPDAINNEWDINDTAVDDIGLIQALIDTVYAEFRIDRNRVYSCGMSMGGFMSYRLACELTDHIAAIASVTGLLATFPCSPSRPIPVLQIHGTEDPTVDYAGVAPTINAWVQKNNCPQSPVVTQLPDKVPSDSTTVTLSYYAPCDDSTEVILYTVNGGGHTWPDALINIGVTSKDINASNIIWNFLKKYKLQAYPEVTHCEWTGTPEVTENKSAFRVQYLSGYLTIETTHTGTFEITLFDALGRNVKSFRSNGENKVVIPCTLSSPGVYFYAISNQQGLPEKGKFLAR